MMCMLYVYVVIAIISSIATDSSHYKISDPDEDLDWKVDCSEEAVRARMQDLTDGAKGLTITDDLEKTLKERMDIFYNSVKQRKDAGTLENPQAAKELLSEADRLEIKTKAPLVLAELLFDGKILIELKKHRVLLLRFTHDDLKAQKYLLGGIEMVISLHKDILLPKVPAIFKAMYDMDILEEKALLDWGSKVSKKYVSKELSQEIHNKAEPFLTWLKEAEEEEETSEEEEDDLEIEYNDRISVTPLKETQKVAEKPKVEEDEGGDDLDIDNI